MVAVLSFHVGQFLIGNSFAPGGFLGVDVFFVLSGFLITSLLLAAFNSDRSARSVIVDFYRRRGRRLMPALCVFLAIWFAEGRIDPLIFHAVPTHVELWNGFSSLAFFNNWVDANGHSLAWAFGQIWTLSIEWQFYLVWPILLVALGAKRGRFRPGVVIGALGIAGLSIWLRTITAGDVYHMTQTNLDGIALGAATAWLCTQGFRLGRLRVLGYPAAAYLGWMLFARMMPFTDPPGAFRLGYTYVALATCILILSVLDEGGPLYRMFSLRPVRYVGNISYSLYLWHYLVFFIVVTHWPHLGWETRVAISIAATTLISAASYRFVELPAMRGGRSEVTSRVAVTPEALTS